MRPFRAGFSLYFALWLLLVMVPAAWALLESGGFDRLLACLETLWRGGFDTVALSAAAYPAHP